MQGVIIGAGIGGLSTAIALKARGIETSVFEAAIELAPLGAGILVPPNALAVLAQYGLASRVKDQGHPIKFLSVVNHKGKLLSSNSATYSKNGGQYPTIALHRGALQRVLLDALGDGAVITGHEFAELRSSADGIEALFKNGHKHDGRFLIGADGLRSKVRQSIFPDSKLRYSGQVCWRGVAKLDLDIKWGAQLTEVWGHGTRFGFVQIAAGQVYWFATSHQKNEASQDKQGKHALIKIFSQYFNPVNDIIESTEANLIIEGPLNDLAPLKKWSKDSVVLLGDAAHAMTPNLGQGGAQAIEDSYALAEQMDDSASLPQAFSQFHLARKAKVNKIVETSRRIGQVSNFSNTWACIGRDLLLRSLAPVVSNRQTQSLYKWP